MLSQQQLNGQQKVNRGGIGAQMIQFALKILMVRIRLLPTVIFFSVLLLGVKVHHVTHKIKNGYDISMETSQAADATTVKAPASAPSDQGGNPSAAPIDPKDMNPEEYNLLQEMEMKKSEGGNPPSAAATPGSATTATGGTQTSAGDPAATGPKQPQILKALEKRMDETVKQLDNSKDELNKLVKSIDQEENANTKRLVKMVEGMKPEQASKVLEGIEFKILLEIMESMSEKKASPILAAMAPEKASYLMTALAKRKKLIKKDNPEKGVMTN